MKYFEWWGPNEPKYRVTVREEKYVGLPENPVAFIQPDWSTVTEFERRIAEFFGAPFAVATDSATSAIELCLRREIALGFENRVYSPKRTYLSVPMLANKLGVPLRWYDEDWKEYYRVSKSAIFDAATMWRRNSYIPHSLMCVSFQYQKHLSVGRLGVILCDNKEAAIELKKLSYDGRLPNVPWREQNVSSYGFHYYATPEACQIALNKLEVAIATPPKIWSYLDYPDVSQMDVFKTKEPATFTTVDIVGSKAQLRMEMEEFVNKKFEALKAELTKEPVKSRSKN
jgi:hypothetical protein